MALSLDDKILGEKTHYYCSSSEEDDGDDEREPVDPKGIQFIPESELQENTGNGATYAAMNTGPKGVIQDWRRFKQLETEQKADQDQERLELAKKIAMTCRSNKDDEKAAAEDAVLQRELEDLEDEFLKEYRAKRFEEMRKKIENIPKFGSLITLSSQQFVEAIDNEKPSVTIVIHLCEDHIEGCIAMNECLQFLAKQYPTVKFCKLNATSAKLSFNFSVNGVPALLVYMNGEVIGNFIRLSDEFGSTFAPADIEYFLHEHGLLPEQSVSKVIRTTQIPDSDSDFD